MKITKSMLRECARKALEQKGFAVEPVRGSGIVQGARLRAKRAGVTSTVAVRTSLDREVGLTRNADGQWATIPRMDQVLVAVPSQHDEEESAEILSFAPAVLLDAFDTALKARHSNNPDFKLKSPIFITLDDAEQSDAINQAGLKARSEWSILVPFTSVSSRYSSRKESESEFFERVQHEFADRHGFDPSKVMVQFTVTS
jgi:hypothetical protein